ncbi:hypothetical protein IFM89_010572, partial [Coptis chinensis]
SFLACRMGVEESEGNDENNKNNSHEAWCINLHTFSDMSHVSPAVFIYLLKESYVREIAFLVKTLDMSLYSVPDTVGSDDQSIVLYSGTQKATAKFRALQQQVRQLLHNSPCPGPATFVVQCLFVLPILGELYTEGFGHLVISSFRRVQTVPADLSEAQALAAQLVLEIIGGNVIYGEIVLIKLLEAFDIRMGNIQKALCGKEVNDDSVDSANTCIESFISRLIQSQSYPTAVALLERFSIRQSDQSFLLKMLQESQFTAAEKWAVFMGKPMICAAIQKYIEMKMFRKAYKLIKDNNLQQEFSEAYHMCKESDNDCDGGGSDGILPWLNGGFGVVLGSDGGCGERDERQVKAVHFIRLGCWFPIGREPFLVKVRCRPRCASLIKLQNTTLYLASSSLKRLAEKGCWDVAEAKTHNNKQLLEYLVYLAMEAGYSEKIDELCERHSLKGFLNSKELETNAPTTRYLSFHELVAEDIIWVDDVNSLLKATSCIEDCKVVGIDCEWKPNYEKGSKPNKVSIMQIASEKTAFIIDMLKLSEVDPTILDHCLKRILHFPSILKLGVSSSEVCPRFPSASGVGCYNLQCDLKQLSHSYKLECFKHYEMLLDLQNVFKEPNGGLSGLAEVPPLSRHINS